MYHFNADQLRTSREFSINFSGVLKNTRILLVQHIMLNTFEYLQHLRIHGGADIFCIFSKPYSINPEARAAFDKEGYNVFYNSYIDLEETNIVHDAIRNAQNLSDADGKSILLLDVGGYFCKPMLEIGDVRHITGIVEDTTFGHNIYEKNILKLPVPVYSVAKSALKEIEARFVGRDAVLAMDTLLRQVGVLISGRRALVVGYGMIGKNVARSLKAHDMRVSCYDKLDIKNLHAFIDGYKIHKKRELIREANIIFSATAEKAVSYDDLKDCTENVILASVGSKDTEFDIASIKQHAIDHTVLKPGLLDKYKLPLSNTVIVAKGGTAVNFLMQSTPTEVLDLVFSEIIYSIVKLCTETCAKGVINTIKDDELSMVAKNWLIGVNMR